MPPNSGQGGRGRLNIGLMAKRRGDTESQGKQQTVAIAERRNGREEERGKEHGKQAHRSVPVGNQRKKENVCGYNESDTLRDGGRSKREREGGGRGGRMG